MSEIYRHIQLLKGVTSEEVGTLTSSLCAPPQEKVEGERDFHFLVCFTVFFQRESL